MPDGIKLKRIRLARSLGPNVEQTFDPATGELAFAMGQVLIGDDLVFDLPTEEDEEQIIAQLINLQRYRPRKTPPYGELEAHKALCACCPCTPIRICALNPEGSQWRRIFKEAERRSDGWKRSARQTGNNSLLAKTAKTLLAKTTNLLSGGDPQKS
jgi:hypothetical protein